MISVIAHEDHNGFVPKLSFIQNIKNATQLGIHESGASAIRAEEFAPIMIRQFGKRFPISSKAYGILSRRRHISGILPGFD